MVPERYSRQIRFRQIGTSGQEKLLASFVVIVGMGALGCVSANELVRAGVGHLRFIDRDLVFDAHVIRNADIIWIQPNAISHSQYYRIVDAARQYRKPIRYFTYASAAKGAEQVTEADK